MPTPVIIDTDPGTDDAIALIVALNSPELDVVGLTTVAGNARLVDTTRNALRLLSCLDRPDIPVFKGANRPMSGSFQFAYGYHGPNGLTTQLPTTDARAQTRSAVDYLVGDVPNGAILIALGPLTNVGRAIRRNPRLGDRIRQIVVMGGAVDVPGNVTPYAEFNIYDDPRAANIVLGSGIPVTLVGFDVGNVVSFRRDETCWRSGTSVGETLAARIIKGWFDIHPDQDEYANCDPLTVAAVIEPGLLEYRQATVTVDEEGETKGRTTATYGTGNVMVASKVDVERARDLILDRLSKRV